MHLNKTMYLLKIYMWLQSRPFCSFQSEGQNLHCVILKADRPLKMELPRWFSGKEPACQCRRHGSIPASGRSLEKEMENHSSILSWRIPRTEEPSGLQSMWLQRVGQDLVTKQQQWKVWRLLQALEEAANLTGWSWGGGNGGHAFLQHILNLLPLGIFLLRGHSLQQLFTTHPCSNYLLRIYCAPGVQATSVVLTLSSVFGPLISSPILQPIRCLHHRNCSFLTFLI